MTSNYNWKRVKSRSRATTATDDNLTRWIGIALFLAIVSHAIVLFAMRNMPVMFGDEGVDEELATSQVVVRSVDARQYLEDAREESEIEPPADAEELLTELEMLEEAPENLEVDFSPTVDEPEMSVEMQIPPLKGDAFSSAEEMTAGVDLNMDAEDLGLMEDFIKPEKGQITIDTGIQNADTFDPDKFSKELAKGAGGDAEDGVIKGFTPLAEMTRLSKSELDKAKGMIGSDLLYEFGKATLRDSARNSLLKVVLLIDKNPEMYCWIEGHTDSIGDEESNRVLSIARAEAVKNWLVSSMKISPEKLIVRGFGESQVVVEEGDREAQAINRRVEIKMRKKLPPSAEQPTRVIIPKRNPNEQGNRVDEGDVQPKPPKALVEPAPMEPQRPPKAIPVEELEVPVKPPKAIPVEDLEVPVKSPRAIPVE